MDLLYTQKFIYRVTCSPVSIEKEAGWALEPIWAFQEELNFLKISPYCNNQSPRMWNGLSVVGWPLLKLVTNSAQPEAKSFHRHSQVLKKLLWMILKLPVKTWNSSYIFANHQLGEHYISSFNRILCLSYKFSNSIPWWNDWWHATDDLQEQKLFDLVLFPATAQML